VTDCWAYRTKRKRIKSHDENETNMTSILLDHIRIFSTSTYLDLLTVNGIFSQMAHSDRKME